MIRLNLFMVWLLHFLSLLSVICRYYRQNSSSRIIVVLVYTVSTLFFCTRSGRAVTGQKYHKYGILSASLIFANAFTHKTNPTSMSKVINKLLVVLLIPSLLLGCVKEAERQQPQEGLHEVVFHAGWSPETKTVLQEDGSVWWSPGDEISLFVSVNDEDGESVWIRPGGYKFTTSINDSMPAASFIGTLKDGENATYHAIYPYDENNTYGKGEVDITIPTIQTAVSGSFDKKTFVSYAKAQDGNLYFKNLCGGIKFSVSQEGIKEVAFRYESGDIMSGKICVDVDNGKINYWNTRYDEVVVQAPANTCFEVGQYYYAIMCPSENDSPVVITYRKEDTEATYKTSGHTSIKRSVFKRLFDKDKDLSFVPRRDCALITINPFHGIDKKESITNVYFHPNTTKTTIQNIGTEYQPVYFELNGTVAHFYTTKDYFNIRKVSKALFNHLRSLKDIDLSNIDASEATDFSFFFSGCWNLATVNWGNFDTSSAVNMNAMFSSCGFEALDLSSFKTANVTNMSAMFEGCQNLRELNLCSFDTKQCQDMSFMFNGCSSIQKLDLSNFDLSPVRDISAMNNDLALHRKQCVVRASEATKEKMCSSITMIAPAAKNYYITWVEPGQPFPNLEDPFKDLYKSIDYSKDKTYSVVQTATKGKGISIVLVGDAYSDRQISDGTYDKDLNRAIDNIFNEEPFRSLKDYFNIYISYAVSENESILGVTALDVCFDDNSSEILGGSNVSNYVRATPSNSEREFPIIISNCHIDAGQCQFYTSGYALIITTLGVDDTGFHSTICHELGHAIGKLADEYDRNGFTFTNQTGFEQEGLEDFWPNVDITNNLEKIKWCRFINDDRYADQKLGAFEGGHSDFAYGIWRPTDNSIMRSASTGFNAPSREAIYKRIHKLAYGDEWQYDYETFVQWDLKNIQSESKISTQSVPYPARVNERKPFFKMENIRDDDGREMIRMIMN